MKYSTSELFIEFYDRGTLFSYQFFMSGFQNCWLSTNLIAGHKITITNFFFSYPEEKYLSNLSNLNHCSLVNGTCLALEEWDQPKAFGEYQYFLSFGGDQYLDIPLAIDAAYGIRGMIVQVGHFISQVSYEVTGYATMGKYHFFSVAVKMHGGIKRYYMCKCVNIKLRRILRPGIVIRLNFAALSIF